MLEFSIIKLPQFRFYFFQGTLSLPPLISNTATNFTLQGHIGSMLPLHLGRKACLRTVGHHKCRISSCIPSDNLLALDGTSGGGKAVRNLSGTRSLRDPETPSGAVFQPDGVQDFVIVPKFTRFAICRREVCSNRAA